MRGQEAETKYRDLSAAAAKSAASGRDDVIFGVGGRGQATARRTTAAVWVGRRYG